MEINMTVNIDNYISEKIRLVSDSAIRLKRFVEEIKREDEFQDDYIGDFNEELDELIRVAKYLKIKEKI
tara:strand:- start:856 stop:1062 length:207 start_codon:yes stop_codon:yes gene_type:complete